MFYSGLILLIGFHFFPPPSGLFLPGVCLVWSVCLFVLATSRKKNYWSDRHENFWTRKSSVKFWKSFGTAVSVLERSALSECMFLFVLIFITSAFWLRNVEKRGICCDKACLPIRRVTPKGFKIAKLRFRPYDRGMLLVSWDQILQSWIWGFTPSECVI